MIDLMHAIQPGEIVTRFGERCTRAEIRTYDEPCPEWFRPTREKRHNAIHKDGVSLYFVIEIDEDARANAHPFTNAIAPNALRLEQLGFTF